MILSASLGTPAHLVARIDPELEHQPIHQAATPPPVETEARSRTRSEASAQPKTTRNPERDAKIVEMSLAGMCQQRIADEFGLTNQRVSQVLRAQAGKDPAEILAEAARNQRQHTPKPRMRGVRVEAAVRFGRWVSGLDHTPDVAETMDELECSRRMAQAMVDAWGRLVNGWLGMACQPDTQSTEASVAFGEWAARLDQPPHTREVMEALQVSRKMAQRYVVVWEKITGQPRRFAPRGRPARRKDMAERDARILGMHRSGRTLLQIAVEFGLTKARIGQILQRARDREAERAAG